MVAHKHRTQPWLKKIGVWLACSSGAKRKILRVDPEKREETIFFARAHYLITWNRLAFGLTSPNAKLKNHGSPGNHTQRDKKSLDAWKLGKPAFFTSPPCVELPHGRVKSRFQLTRPKNVCVEAKYVWVTYDVTRLREKESRLLFIGNSPCCCLKFN